jgi:hypothetical protein
MFLSIDTLNLRERGFLPGLKAGVSAAKCG